MTFPLRCRSACGRRYDGPHASGRCQRPGREETRTDDRPHGGRHQPREAPGHRVPVRRDLRRTAVVVGLRPARGGAPAEHPQRLVARDRAAARRRRRRRGRGDHEPARVAGERAPRDVPRPARRVHELPPAVPRGPPRGRRERHRHVPELRRRRVHRAEAVQPDAEDVPRAGRGRRRRRVPAPGDRAGHVRELPGVQTVSRKKLPFGIAQIGKSFRNEITPGNFIFRTREFEQMEMEFFVEPGTDDEWFEYWVEQRMQWYLDLGVSKEKLRLRPHEPDELAHYAKAATDVEYEFPFGWQELEGIANRTDYDLAAHQDGERRGPHLLRPGDTRPRYLPYVVEPAVGVDRAMLDVPARRLPRRGGADREGRHRQAHGARAAPRPRADQGRRAAAVAQREARARGAARARPGQARVDDPVRRRRCDRPPLPAPGRGRHAVLRHGRLRLARRPPGDRARARHDAAGPHRRSTAWSAYLRERL